MPYFTDTVHVLPHVRPNMTGRETHLTREVFV
jgi:hypothetical protein